MTTMPPHLNLLPGSGLNYSTTRFIKAPDFFTLPQDPYEDPEKQRAARNTGCEIAIIHEIQMPFFCIVLE
jgi:hypothetical protein